MSTATTITKKLPAGPLNFGTGFMLLMHFTFPGGQDHRGFKRGEGWPLVRTGHPASGHSFMVVVDNDGIFAQVTDENGAEATTPHVPVPPARPDGYILICGLRHVREGLARLVLEVDGNNDVQAILTSRAWSSRPIVDTLEYPDMSGLIIEDANLFHEFPPEDDLERVYGRSSVIGGERKRVHRALQERIANERPTAEKASLKGKPTAAVVTPEEARDAKRFEHEVALKKMEHAHAKEMAEKDAELKRALADKDAEKAKALAEKDASVRIKIARYSIVTAIISGGIGTLLGWLLKG